MRKNCTEDSDGRFRCSSECSFLKSPPHHHDWEAQGAVRIEAKARVDASQGLGTAVKAPPFSGWGGGQPAGTLGGLGKAGQRAAFISCSHLPPPGPRSGVLQVWSPDEQPLIWELVHLRPTDPETLGVQPSNRCFTKGLPGGSEAQEGLRTTDPSVPCLGDSLVSKSTVHSQGNFCLPQVKLLPGK